MKTFKIEFCGRIRGSAGHDGLVGSATIEASNRGTALKQLCEDFQVFEGEVPRCVDITREAAAVRTLQTLLSRQTGEFPRDSVDAMEQLSKSRRIVRDFFNEYPELKPGS